MVALVCWGLWKQWNRRVFGRRDIFNEWELASLIFQELKLWAITGKK